jgi:hypothetical protein
VNTEDQHYTPSMYTVPMEETPSLSTDTERALWRDVVARRDISAADAAVVAYRKRILPTDLGYK